MEKSRESLAGSAGSGRKRRPQIEQAYSPDQTRLPSRMAITALRQIFLPSIRKAYTDSSIPISEKVSNGCTAQCSSQWNFRGRFVKMNEVRQTIRRSFCFATGV